MSQVQTFNTGGGPTPPTATTVSGENGTIIAAVGNNFNFSGSTAGGAAANGAFLFHTAVAGEVDGAVQVDGTTIMINGSNKLQVINTGTFTWVVQTADITAVPNTGYFAASVAIRPAGGLHLTLPSPSTIGQTFKVYDYNGNGWFVLQSGTQTIKISTDTTTPGTGSIFSQNSGGGDSATLVCSDSTLGAEVWVVTDYDGNIGVN